MPIQSGDVKLLRSSIMSDAPESGGAPTGVEIPDGVSNAIFPDISELDRAGGRVNLRKTFVGVHTNDTDTYFGANVIVADPPDDPRVSVTLFSTGRTFDTRAEAQSRIESYLNKGPEWPGYLYENHIQGQRAVQLFQRPTDPLPVVGQTLVLIENEGKSTQKEQYVRVTSVSSVIRTFTYNQGGTPVDYQAAIVTCEISDALRFDFTGAPSNRFFVRSDTKDGSTINPDLTKLRDTVVADAGSYVGAVKLAQAASIGDFTVKADGIFTQLVPSAQVETPVVNADPYNLISVLVPLGGPVSYTETRVFTTRTSYRFRAFVLPGSLSMSAGSVTVTDNGAGRLFSGGTQVGTIDYENAIATLTTDVFGASAVTLTINVTHAAAWPSIRRSFSIPVTAATRSLSYTRSVNGEIVRGVASVSYRSQGRWYVLYDQGDGTIKGLDTSYGVGTVDYSNGSFLLTLGALPDVGSEIIFNFQFTQPIGPLYDLSPDFDSKLFFAFNTSGDEGWEKGSSALTPNGVTLTWQAPEGGLVTATDNGNGVLSGAATGVVDYQKGVVYFSPSALPAPSTVVTLANNRYETSQVSAAFFGGGTGFTVALGTNVTPNTVLSSTFQIYYSGLDFISLVPGRTGGGSGAAYIKDDGNGNILLYVEGLSLSGKPYTGYQNRGIVGSIDYSTGQLNVALSASVLHGVGDVSCTSYTWNGITREGVTVTFRYGNLTTLQSIASSINISCGRGVAVTAPVSVTLTKLFGRVQFLAPDWTMRGLYYRQGSRTITARSDGVLVSDYDSTTGVGVNVGVLNFVAGDWYQAVWTAGSSPSILDFRARSLPTETGKDIGAGESLFVFRTPAAPLRSASLQVFGRTSDGININATADANGIINTPRLKGKVNYEQGVVKLLFTNPNPTPLGTVDISDWGITGVTTVNLDYAAGSTVKYNAVAYSYLPLDASLIGIDPVRLPSDGRVPIFRKGGFAVVGHTGEIGPITVSNGQTINCGRVRLSRVRVIGNNGAVINTGYTADLEAGTVTFTDVSGYSQPVRIQHRIEDMGVISDVQINGDITFTRPLTHAYPANTSYVSSALIAGDLYARVSLIFDQTSWNGTWSDSVVGSPATANFNSTVYPITVTNRGAITERWIVRFTNTTSFEVIGENVGVIATGNTATDCSPINPATGVPYFTIPALGWGSGWSTGNVLRFNTIGAMYPVWVVRTVQQGPESVPDDHFTLLIRGDVDTP